MPRKAIAEEWKEETARKMIIWFQDAGNLWFKDFAHTITNPTYKMPYSWLSLNKVCSGNAVWDAAVELIKEMQESRLYKLGLELKSNMPIFALKNVAGWRDTKDEPTDDNELSETVTIVSD